VLETDPDLSKQRYKSQAFIEPESSFHPRVFEFISWLSLREEKVIGLVGHYDTIAQFTGVQLNNCQLFPTIFDHVNSVFYPFHHQVSNLILLNKLM
jgi:hypothetical protein